MNPVLAYNPQNHRLTLENKNCTDEELIAAIDSLSVAVIDDTAALDLSEAFFLKTLPQNISKLRNLKTLIIVRCHNLVSLESIKSLPIVALIAGHCTELETPQPILELKLKVLDLNNCTGFKRLDFLAHFAESLEELNIQNVPRAQLAKESLLALRKLRTLNIKGTGIQNLDQFKFVKHLIG
jgi:hypothetical protein